MKELRTEVRNSLLFSVHAGDVVRFAGFGLRGFLGGVADDAVADALVVAFDAPFFQQCFAFGEVEHLLGAVYPATAQTYGMGGVHKVAHDQGAVIDAVGGLPLGEDDEDDGRSVERVGVGSHDAGVKLREAVADGFVGHRYDDGGLASLAGGGVGARFGDAVNEGLIGHFIPVGADGTSGFQDFEGFVGLHVVLFLSVAAGCRQERHHGEQ